MLTIKPNAPLDYAAGEVASIPALLYSVGLSGTAKDAAGNALEPFISSFSTLKEITTIIYGEGFLDGEVTNVPGGVNATKETIRVGQLVRSIFSFPVSSITPPDGNYAYSKKTKATLNIYKEGFLGNPYASSKLTLEHMVGYDLKDQDFSFQGLTLISDSFDSASVPSKNYLSIDVSESFAWAVSSSEVFFGQARFRLSFPRQV